MSFVLTAAGMSSIELFLIKLVIAIWMDWLRCVKFFWKLAEARERKNANKNKRERRDIRTELEQKLGYDKYSINTK